MKEKKSNMPKKRLERKEIYYIFFKLKYRIPFKNNVIVYPNFSFVFTSKIYSDGSLRQYLVDLKFLLRIF